MRIDVAENRSIRLKEVFNSVVFETKEGEKLFVCMRDGGFEIGIKDLSIKSKEEYYSHYRIIGGVIEEMGGEEKKLGMGETSGAEADHGTFVVTL